MGDDKSKRGSQDRAKIATKQQHEMKTARRATGATTAAIEKAVKDVGHGRKAVYKKLKDK